MKYTPILAFALLAGLSAQVWAAAPDSYSTTFENMTPGSIYGQEGWSDANAANGSVYDQGIVAGAGLVGGKAWLLSNKTSDGANAGIEAPTVAYAGEGVDARGNVPVGNQFTESFDFRTVSSTAETNLDISNSIGQAASIRDTYVDIYEQSGSLFIADYATDASGGFTISNTSPALTWGAWYQVSVTADFLPGADNDRVTYSITDASGAAVWQDTIGSWETYYAADPTAEGAPLVDVDRVSWDLADAGGSADSGIYVDNFSEAVGEAPEPSTYAMMLGGLALLGFFARRKLA